MDGTNNPYLDGFTGSGGKKVYINVWIELNGFDQSHGASPIFLQLESSHSKATYVDIIFKIR